MSATQFAKSVNTCDNSEHNWTTGLSESRPTASCDAVLVSFENMRNWNYCNVAD